MSRFQHERSMNLGGTTLNVKIRHSGHRTKITNTLGKELGKARELLQATLAQLNNAPSGSAYKRFANRYFLTPTSGPSPTDLATIKSIIILTSNGLGADNTIKVGNNVGRNDKDVHGSVSNARTADSKSYHNQVRDLDDGKMYRTGAIRMDEDTLLNGGRLAVVTLLHEATHKFAGTNDYCYFKDDSYSADGDFNDKTEALKNADGYAWFIYKMGNTYHL
jgi:hypothetical protein